MTGALKEIKKFIGRFSGRGTNHEKEVFVGDFEMIEFLDGKGFQIKFSARSEGSPNAVFHSEVSTIAPNLTGSVSLFNFNTNSPFLAEHALISTDTKASGQDLIFRFGDTQNRNSFREEVRLELLNDGRVGYHYSWGMPDGDFAYRSGVIMEKNIGL